MNTSRRSLILALILGAAIGAGVVSYVKAPTAQAASPEQQWEYKVFYFKGSSGASEEEEALKLTKEFNSAAAEGWQFAGSLGGGRYDVFRRPKK